MKYVFRIFVLILVGCRHQSAEQHYVDYINDPKNKLVQQIKVGDVVATLKWLPAEYNLIMKKNRKLDTTTSNGYYYFDMKFEKISLKKSEKNKMLYLDFDIQNDFIMVPGKDSILPVICQRIENGIAGSYEYMLVFEKGSYQSEGEDFEVVYKDKVLGIGTVAFVYKLEDIRKIPKLI